MNKAVEITDMLKDLDKLSESIQGAKISIYSDSDYSMLKISIEDGKEVVILDLKRAVGEGMKTLHNSKMTLNSPYIIVITGLNNEDFKKRCYGLGADYFFDKNDDIKLLNDILNKLFSFKTKIDRRDIEYV